MNNTGLTNTPLMEAITTRDYEVAKQIIESAVDVNAENINEETAFMMFDLSYISIPSFGSDCDINCKIEKVIEIMTLLLDNGANINHKNKDGQTIFMKYVNHYSLLTIFLIEKGANINDVDNIGKTPLFYAMQPTGYYANGRINYNCNDKLWFIKLLIDCDAQINVMTKDKITPLMIASQMKSDEVVKLLIQRRAIVDEQDKNRETALLKVFNNIGFGIQKNGTTDENIFKTLKVLLDARADTSIKNTQDKTPFMLAVENNLADAIKLFIINGVNPIEEDIDIHSLFVNSLWYNDNFDLSIYLLDNKFDINSLDKNKNTPLLSIIQDECNENIIKFLINHGADINIQNEFGYTPLMMLVRDLEDKNNSKIILDFIEKSDKINAALKDDKLTTAHTLAIINKKEKFAKILEGKGADTLTTLKYLLANDLYFEKEYFEKKLESFLPQEIECKIRLSLLESWSYFDKRIDVDKIDKCIFLLEKLQIRIGENKSSFGYSVGSYLFKQIDESLAEVRQELENNLFSMESKTFEDVLKQFIDFPEKNHELSKILKKFSNDERLKYSNHDWDISTMKNGKELTYKNFIDSLTKGWKDIENSLKIYAPTLHNNIKSFLFENIQKESDLFGEKITLGWSSTEVIKKELTGGSKDKKPEYYKEFQKMIDIFKKSFVIKENEKDYSFKKIFLNLKKELKINCKDFSLHIDVADLKKKRDFKIFTDVPSLKLALASILKQINNVDNEVAKDEVKISIIEENLNDKKTILLKIIHVNSSSSKSAEELADNIKNNGGDFKTIYDNLHSICDWSIDTQCKDGARYKIDYLYPKTDSDKAHITKIDNEFEGFTYILRFYI